MADSDDTDFITCDGSSSDDLSSLGYWMDYETIGLEDVFKKSEFIRVITETLYRLGFDNVGALLEEESGIPMYNRKVNLFLQQVEAGEWDESIATLHKLALNNEKIVESASFWLLKQKFLEFIKLERISDALDILRKDIASLDVEEEYVHELASNLMKTSSDLDMESVNSWSVTLEQLYNLFPPGLIIPEKRLEYFVETTLIKQRDACTFHNVPNSDLSLLSDHYACEHSKIPRETVQILESHADEVWYLEFSHNGKYLASSSKDKTAIIWEVNSARNLLLKHRLIGHKQPVVSVLWRHDDTQVITCGEEEEIRRWDVDSGDCLQLCRNFVTGPVSCAWFPDGNSIIGAMSDKTVIVWNLNGTLRERWRGPRLCKFTDIAMTDDSKWVISMTHLCVISIINRQTREEKLIYTDDIITSFTLCTDNEHLLVNLINQKICLFNIDFPEPWLIRSYTGIKRERFMIRSCFGGYEQSFTASGSEDSKLYIWFRRGELLEELEGHSGAVNCVSWNPVHHQMLASASDDGTIRIWGLEQ